MRFRTGDLIGGVRIPQKLPKPEMSIRTRSVALTKLKRGRRGLNAFFCCTTTDLFPGPAKRGGGTGALGRVPWDVRQRAGGNPSARCARCRVARRSCASVPVEGAVLIVCAALQLVRLAAVDGDHDCRLRRDATGRGHPALHPAAAAATCVTGVLSCVRAQGRPPFTRSGCCGRSPAWSAGAR